MLKQYLELLKDSLENKLEILTAILAASEKQNALTTEDPFDMEAFDALVDEKDGYVTRLNRMDEGFQSLYEKIRDNLQAEKEQYQVEIASLQELIGKVTDKSVQIQALESRNKQALEQIFTRERQKLNTQKNISKVARQYHESMNQMHVITPQFLDNKK